MCLLPIYILSTLANNINDLIHMYQQCKHILHFQSVITVRAIKKFEIIIFNLKVIQMMSCDWLTM